MGGVQDLCEDVQLAMWKNFIDKVFEVVGKRERKGTPLGGGGHGDWRQKKVACFFPRTTLEREYGTEK